MDYLLFLQNLRCASPEAVNLFLLYVSNFTGSVFLMIIPVFVYWCIDKKAGIYMTMCFSIAVFLNQTLKNIFCVLRPHVRWESIVPMDKALDGATGFSFPSGHTTLAAGVYGGIAVWQKKRKWVVLLCILLTLLTAFSRNWLGVHTLADTAGAIFFACFSVFIATCIEKYIKKNPKAFLPAVILAIASALFSIAFICLKPYPKECGELVDIYAMQTDSFKSAGVLLGFACGVYIEQRFVNFSNSGKMSERIVRFIVGFAAISALYTFVFPIIFSPFGEHWGKLLKYFFLMLSVLALYPAVFSYFSNRKSQR